VLCTEHRNNKSPTLRKYFKDCCQILSKVIKETKRMEYDRHILNSNNVMRSSQLNYTSNRTLFTGVFRSRLKYAIIRPLFKKDNKNDMSNCRPISILTSFSKLF
jgi:hypothetical protein